MRQVFFVSVLLAAIVSAPIPFIAVGWHGLLIDIGRTPEAVHASTIALMRTFVVAFDVSLLAAWPPCAVWCARQRVSGAPAHTGLN